MPDPLPSDIVARLRSDYTAALAASLILAGSFPDIVSWALGKLGGVGAGGAKRKQRRRPCCGDEDRATADGL
jgi:hypothetical protein